MKGAIMLSGGGGTLNFRVIGSATEPLSPKENDIWVKTDAEVTEYAFSIDEPGGIVKDGAVWITTGASSHIAFNALKKNGIMVYPLSAKQYVAGTWVDKEAKSYQSGAWVDWVTYLFVDGNQCESLTGGWTLNGYTHPSITLKPGTFTGEKMEFAGASGVYQVLGTADAISLRGKKGIRVVGEVTSVFGSGNNANGLALSVSTTKSFSNLVAELAMNKVGKFDYTLDTSGLANGDYYVLVRAEAAPGCAGYVTEVRLV